MLWLAVAITLVAATSSAIGKALQKQSTTSLPRFSLDRVVVRQYFSSRTWLLGVVADVLGGIIQIGAFALAPVRFGAVQGASLGHIAAAPLRATRLLCYGNEPITRRCLWCSRLAG